jgi:transposase
VKKQYRPWAPEQSYLLPPSPREWLPKGHLAFFVMEVVGALDISAIEAEIDKRDPRGERPYAPRMMIALLLYGYCAGVFSSRKLERGTYEDVPLRVIGGEAHPHFTSINRFRLEYREALAGFFGQVLKLCRRAGLKTVGHVALDGSKVQANASKHKAMSYGRMKDDEKKLEAEIEALLRHADEVDAREDEQYGADMRGDEIPEELKHRETRLKRIRELMAELEQEAAAARAAQLRENAAALRSKSRDLTVPERERHAATTRAARSDAQAKKLAPRKDDDDDDGTPGTQLSLGRVPATRDGKPKDKAQRNFTDGDSRIMVRNKVFLQSYNAQAAVSEDQIIVAHGVTNDATDAKQLEPMLERVKEACGAHAKVVTADTGYLSEHNVAYCAKNGIDAYIAVRKSEVAKLPRGPDGPGTAAACEMHLKVSSLRGKAIYARRKTLVEPVFGQIKGAMGFRRFSLRGLGKVASEWAIVCLCHNLLKLFRTGRLLPA